MKATIILFFTFLFILKVFSKTAEEWKSRSVYQIITDRFAKSDGSFDECHDLGNYCGGTFKGIQNNLDYIQGMGFNAIWISPIVANNPGGYHGYWTSNLYEINENFGTPQELHELIEACHERDIWIMVDVVANHVGYVDNLNFSSIIPFNDIEYYNAYKHCDNVTQGDQEGIETCWLNGLPDLDQNNPFVRNTFLTWIADFVKQYNIDALRIDTVPHVTKDFWNEFSQAAGVFTIGEILSFDLPYIAGYQGYVDSVLNYALYSTMRYAFQNEGSMSSIESYYEGAHSTYSDVTILGNFVDNHDNPRFLSGSNNHQNFKAALAFSICSVGIPMVYYGDEQAFSGGMDPANREPLWTNMDTRTDIYHYLKTLNDFRTETKFYEYDQTQRYADTNFYAFTRGEYFFAFTNSQDTQVRSITFHPYAEGTTLCNIFHKGDCVEVKDGQFPVVLLNGEVKIFTPSLQDSQQAEPPKKTWSSIKELWGSSTVFEMNSRNSFWRHTN